MLVDYDAEHYWLEVSSCVFPVSFFVVALVILKDVVSSFVSPQQKREDEVIKHSERKSANEWYQIHVGRKCVDNHTTNPNSTATSPSDVWVRSMETTLTRSPFLYPSLRTNRLLMIFVKIGLKLLRQAPEFLEDAHPLPRAVLHAFFRCLINNSSCTKVTKSYTSFLCCRLEAIFLHLGSLKIHDDGSYSIPREDDSKLSRPTAFVSDDLIGQQLFDWRHDVWKCIINKKDLCCVEDSRMPRVALALGLEPELSMRYLTDATVVKAYVVESPSASTAAQRFGSDIRDVRQRSFPRGQARKSMVACLDQFQNHLKSNLTCRGIAASHDFSSSCVEWEDWDLAMATLHITTTYFGLACWEEGLRCMSEVFDLVENHQRTTILQISHVLRYLALVAWARYPRTRRRGSQKRKSISDGELELGSRLFSVYGRLKLSPTCKALHDCIDDMRVAITYWDQYSSEQPNIPVESRLRVNIGRIGKLCGVAICALDEISYHFAETEDVQIMRRMNQDITDFAISVGA